MSLQDKLNEMSGPALANWWNDHCEKANKSKVTKFKDLTTGRDRCYHLAWELNLLDQKEAGEGGEQGNAGMTAEQAENLTVTTTTVTEGNDQTSVKQTEETTQSVDSAAVGTASSTTDAGSSEGETTAPSDRTDGEEEGELDTSPLIGRLKLRKDTHKAKVAIRLAKSAGGYVSHEDLTQAAYGKKADKETVGNLRMVLKGVKVALAKYAPEHELRTERGTVGIFLKSEAETAGQTDADADAA